LARCAGALWPVYHGYNSFNRWFRRGIWEEVFDTPAAKSRDSLPLIDATIIKAHRAAKGANRGTKIR
jgi:transposase